MASLGHTGRRRIVLGHHTLNTQTLTKTGDEHKKVLSKFMILCWATFIVILGRVQPSGRGLDTPVGIRRCIEVETSSNEVRVRGR